MQAPVTVKGRVGPLSWQDPSGHLVHRIAVVGMVRMCLGNHGLVWLEGAVGSSNLADTLSVLLGWGIVACLGGPLALV